MSRVIDLPDGVIPHTPAMLAIEYFQFSISAVSVVFGTVILVAIAKQKDKTVGMLFIASFCLGDLCYSWMQSITNVINLSYGGFALGKMGCVANAQISVGAAFISILSLVAMNCDRYLILVHGYYMSRAVCLMTIASFWISSLIIINFPIYSGSYPYLVSLMPVNTYCMVTTFGKEPLTIFAISMCCVVVFIGIAGNFFCYFSIYQWYKKMNLMKLEVRGDLSRRATRTMSSNETKLLKRAVIITGAFFLCVSFVYMMILQ